MGKAGRVACIFTPWALTVASLVCLMLIEIAGWQVGSSTLNSLYFFQADFRNLTTSSASKLDNTTTLTAALELAEQQHLLSDVYQVHLWNYCYSNETNGTIQGCSSKHSNYYFDPVEAWGLNSTNATSTATGSADNPIASAVASAKNNTEEFENKVLGKTGADALNVYKNVAKWMFIAYEVSFWTTVATILCSVLAVFSRVGSFLTWVFSIVSSLFTLAAVLTSTILFPTLVAALHEVLHPYGVKLTVGTSALGVGWLAVALSWAATLFWLFSVCCCPGRSNPHHRSNKGGLWDAEPKGQGYGEYGYGRGRGVRVEKTGGGYERVASPFLGHAVDESGDRVPLQPYPQGHQRGQSSGAFEPFRHT